jgi:putative IMPACT (imprinted ancient) family translation regulator
MPILQLFSKQEIINFVCVVARIFGGVLLGKGGLARAYTAAAKNSLQAAGFGPLIIYRKYAVTVPYPEWDKTKYNLEKNEIPIDAVAYTHECIATVTVTDGQEAVFRKLVEMMAVEWVG